MTWSKTEKGILTACARRDDELEVFRPSILVVDEQERPPRFNNVSDSSSGNPHLQIRFGDISMPVWECRDQNEVQDTSLRF